MNTWDKESIHKLLDTSHVAVERAILAIYARQDSDEQRCGTTHKANGRGFSQFDAEFMTSLAKELKQRGALSHRQITAARKGIKRYWRQLVEIANAREAEKAGIEPKIEAAEPDIEQEIMDAEISNVVQARAASVAMQDAGDWA